MKSFLKTIAWNSSIFLTKNPRVFYSSGFLTLLFLEMYFIFFKIIEVALAVSTIFLGASILAYVFFQIEDLIFFKLFRFKIIEIENRDIFIRWKKTPKDIEKLLKDNAVVYYLKDDYFRNPVFVFKNTEDANFIKIILDKNALI